MPRATVLRVARSMHVARRSRAAHARTSEHIRLWPVPFRQWVLPRGRFWGRAVLNGLNWQRTGWASAAGQQASLIADDVYKIIIDNAERIDATIIYDRDFDYDYFGFKTLERSYLLRINGQVRRLCCLPMLV